MDIFHASEIVEFAVRIHDNGAHFYEYAIQLVDNEEAKGLFAELAEEERMHKKSLEKIFARMEKYLPPETYTGEYVQYLRNYIDNNIVFTKEAIDADLATVKNACSAIDFAARRELDSICYYESIKSIVPEAEHKVVDNIIAGERNHFVKLTNLRKCIL
ncbi:MAG: ferritin family protein [Syntrophales bacterium]|nr:ferritin family protein [Syntrophales bacterium]